MCRDINIISIEILLHSLLSGKLYSFEHDFFFFKLICRHSHGLSYTKFALSNLRLSEVDVSNGEFKLVVSVTIENIGRVIGSEVIQVYISLPAATLELTTTHQQQPVRQLKGFTKVHDLVPGNGNKEDVEVVLDKYAVSYWNDWIDAWRVEKGVYRVEVGTGGGDCLSLGATFEVMDGFDWSGL